MNAPTESPVKKEQTYPCPYCFGLIPCTLFTDFCEQCTEVPLQCGCPDCQDLSALPINGLVTAEVYVPEQFHRYFGSTPGYQMTQKKPCESDINSDPKKPFFGIMPDEVWFVNERVGLYVNIEELERDLRSDGYTDEYIKNTILRMDDIVSKYNILMNLNGFCMDENWTKIIEELTDTFQLCADKDGLKWIARRVNALAYMESNAHLADYDARRYRGEPDFIMKGYRV
jgi:hypothetical protein